MNRVSLRRALLSLLVLLLGLVSSSVVQGATIDVAADKQHAQPGDRLTFTLTVVATREALLTVSNLLPYGVQYAGNLSPAEAQYAEGRITWSRWMTEGERVVIRYDALVATPGTEGPRPIVNRACADDGQVVCSLITVSTGWLKHYLPFVSKVWTANSHSERPTSQVAQIVPRPALLPATAGLFPSHSDRFGFGINPRYGEVDDVDVGRLRGGWYVDWRVHLDPPQPAGLDFYPMVWTSGDRFSPNAETLTAIATANPGDTWLVGNEPDGIYNGNATPDQYARVYHEVYSLLKAADPSARVAIGGIVQATPLRMQWLDMVWARYQELYGEPMPVDVWNLHAFLLNEDRYGWGCGIPPGISADQGELRGADDHDRMDLFAEQIVRFRRWMKDHGQQNKPLIVSEYGILLVYNDGFDAPRVEAFMLNTFDYFMTAVDVHLGFPADGYRLVQMWNWFALNEKRAASTFFHLFDPYTLEITSLGLAWENYVMPLYVPYVDLVPAALHVALDVPPALESIPMGDSQPITVTLTATIQNGGNTDVDNVSVQFWRTEPRSPSSVPAGGPAPAGALVPIDARTIAALAARSRSTLSVQWQNVPPGAYTVGVTVDEKGHIDESDEGNNQLMYNLVVAGTRTYLPLCMRGR